MFSLKAPPHISVSDDGPRVGIGKLHPVSQIYVSGDKNLVQPHSLTLSFTYGCFQAATAELNSPNRDSIPHPHKKKKKNTIWPLTKQVFQPLAQRRVMFFCLQHSCSFAQSSPSFDVVLQLLLREPGGQSLSVFCLGSNPGSGTH